jgi:hypothetical protein
MAIQLGALRDALIDAGAKPELAGRASEEMAACDRQFSRVEPDFITLKSDVNAV